MTIPDIYADPQNSTFYRAYTNQWGSTVQDLDGSLTGHPGFALVTNQPMMLGDQCVQLGDSNFGYHEQ